VCRLGLDRLQESGATLVPGDVPALLKEAWTIAVAVISYEVIANESAYLAKYDSGLSFADFKQQISPPIRNRFDTAFTPGAAEALRPEQYKVSLDQLAMIRPAIDNYLKDNRLNAIVFPTTLTAALKIGVDADTEVAGHIIPVRFAMARNIAGATCAGIPGLSLPAGLSASGLPVGLEFDVGHGEDVTLLQLGLALERALGPIAPPRNA
jgi:mandelamide amidase